MRRMGRETSNPHMLCVLAERKVFVLVLFFNCITL